MSWFGWRWRPKRNSICNVNCKILWIIKLLNVHDALTCSTHWRVRGFLQILFQLTLRKNERLVFFPFGSNNDLKKVFIYNHTRIYKKKTLLIITVFFFSYSYDYTKNNQNKPWSSKDYALNLSILLSAGRENNNDLGSNGEWNPKRTRSRPVGPICRVLEGSHCLEPYALNLTGR